MVKTALAVFAALTALAPLALAQPPPDPDYYDDEPEPEDADESPSFNMFGFSFAIGGFPIDGTDTLAMSIGLSVEHPVFKRTRVVAEYDFLWLVHRDAPTARMLESSTMLERPEEHGTGHRASVALRRELKGKGKGSARVFLDGELGGSLALVNQTRTGAQLVPGGFAGVRLGYDLYSRRDDSPSRTFEIALLLRATALPDGAGLSVGLGMFWGN